MPDSLPIAPNKAPHLILADLLSAKGITQKDLATRLSMNRSYLNQVLNGHYPLSAELRLKLQPLLGVRPEFWAEVQRNFELWKHSDEGRAEIRRESEDRLYLTWDARGAHVLVDHEIEAAIRAELISISDLDLSLESDRIRLGATTLELTFGAKATVHSLVKIDDRNMVEEMQPVSLRSGFTLKRGQRMTFETRENIRLPARFRMVVNGLSDRLIEQAVHGFHRRVIEPGSTGPVSFGLINAGLLDLPIREGESCLSVSFEYLAQSTSAHPE